MNYSVDVAFEYKKAKSTFSRLSLLFSGVLTCVIIANVLLVTLAGEEYRINLIISSVITVLFAWFAIFFFTSIYGDVNNRYRYFKGYGSGVKPTEEVEFIRKTNTLCYVNGLYVYPINVLYMDGLSKQEKVIYTFDESLSFAEGDKLTITTYQRIIIKAEKHS